MKTLHRSGAKSRNTLFSAHFYNNKGIKNEAALLFACEDINLPNTSSLDVKLNYLLASKRFNEAIRVLQFYHNLWDFDDQVKNYL